MPRKINFRGNTIVLNDEAPAALKVGDRVRYTVHDWMEGEHTLSGQVVALKPDGTEARVRVGAGIAADILHVVPTLALTVAAPVIPIKGAV